jgi:hypothetical protein
LNAGGLDRDEEGLDLDALQHRVWALECLNKRLSGSWSDVTPQETNALISTCLLLSFQAIHLSEGVGEFITLMRGVAVIGEKTIDGNIQSVLLTMFEGLRAENNTPWTDIPLFWDGQTSLSVEAIKRLESLCPGPLETEYHEKLLCIAEEPSSSQNACEFRTSPLLSFEDELTQPWCD